MHIPIEDIILNKAEISQIEKVIISRHQNLEKFKKRKHQTIYFMSTDINMIKRFFKACKVDSQSLANPMEWLSGPALDINFVLHNKQVISLGVFLYDSLSIPNIGDVKLADEDLMKRLLEEVLG